MSVRSGSGVSGGLWVIGAVRSTNRMERHYKSNSAAQPPSASRRFLPPPRTPPRPRRPRPPAARTGSGPRPRCSRRAGAGAGATRLAATVRARAAACSRRFTRSTVSRPTPLASALARVASSAASSLSTAVTGPKPSIARGDRQHPRAAAEVRERAARLELEHELQRELRGRVGSGAEGLPGIDDEVEGVRARLCPRGPHPDPVAHQHRLVELLPPLRPVLGHLLPAHPRPARRPPRPRPPGTPAARPVRRRARTRRSPRRRPARPRSGRAPAARRAPARRTRAGARNASRISGTRGAACRRSTRRPARAGCPRRGSRAAP